MIGETQNTETSYNLSREVYQSHLESLVSNSEDQQQSFPKSLVEH